MELGFGPEIEAFAAEVRAFIRENLPEETRRKVAAERMDLPREEQAEWIRRLNARGGWSCPSWPREHGGPGWSDEQLYVFERELAMNDAPRPHIYASGMLGPTLMAYGTDAQKARFLPPMLTGDVFWCQGYSEPNAGSDLASLQCRADRDDDHYVLNGSKIWTSEAHIADWMFGVFRTDASGKKQHGITFLMLDMTTPGVTVRPLLTYEYTHEVNQVFFDDVRVPVENRVGEEHQGWTVAKYLLGLERFGTAEVSRSLASLARLERWAGEIPFGDATLADDPRFAAELTAVRIGMRALELTEQRFLFGPGGADAMGAEASMLKIRGTELQQRILDLTTRAMGWYAQVTPAPDGSNLPVPGPEGAAWAARNYFNYRKTSIYSGSNEIQKNIIAKAVMGL